jgi:tetratricopeptide (TPR) repeat protein
MSEQPSDSAGLADGTLARGASIGRYLVTSRLGAGGMGVVYAAYDPELNRKLAIKLLRPSGDVEGDTQGRVRLLREAQAMAQLSHPNVISVFDVGTAYNQVFVAMEFVDGGTLTDWLKSPRTPEEILAVFHQAGCGLQAAHAAGLIHRDFKPDNTMVGSDGRVRVMDFGLARVAGEAPPLPTPEHQAQQQAIEREDTFPQAKKAAAGSSPSSLPLSTPMTQTGALMGTPRYMSPEQFRGQPVDGRSDQFSFCVALFEALCGIPPFTGDSIGERCYNVLQGNVLPPPSGKRPPAWLLRALLRGLAVRPEDRHPDMAALLKQLSPEARQARKRRVMGIIAALTALLIAAGVFGGLRAQRLRAARLCDDSAARIESVFGAAMRAQVQKALLGSGKSFAGSAWERTERNVDDYLLQWRDMRRTSCRSALISRTENRRLHERRMRCLDSLLQEVSAFTTLLLRADPAIVERAAETSETFTPLSSCADNVALMALLPERPEVRERVDGLNRELAEVRVISKLARYEQAQERAKRAVESAQKIGYAPAVARALQLVASIENDNADFPGAERDYFAMAVAALSGGDSRATAIAFVELMRLSGRYRKQFEQADRYEQLAQAALARASGSESWNGSFEVQRLWYKCQVDFTQKEWKKAEQSCQKALQLRDKFYQVDSSKHLGILISLANVYKQQEKFFEALALYQQALSIAEKTYGPVHPNIAVNLSNIGSLLTAQQKHAEAADYFRRSLEIHKRVFGPRHPRLFSAYAALTRSAYLQDRFDEAVAYATQAQSLVGELSGATIYAAAPCLLGDALYRKGSHEEARVQHEQALERCDPKRCEAEWPYFLIALSDDLRALRKSKQALPMLQEALRLLSPKSDGEVLARAKFSFAQTLLDVEKQRGWARAEELATSALVLYRNAGRHTEREQAAISAWLRKYGPNE